MAEQISFVDILIYGNPGVGKTVLAGSADAVPDMRPVLFVDIEGGTLSIRNRYPEVDVVRVENWKQMQRVYDSLMVEDHGYQTIVLDSLTEIQKFSMYNIMVDLVREHEDRDPDIPSMREWGKNIEQMRRFVRAFRDLPMHTVFTALAKTDKDQKTGVIMTKPYMSGKLADEVAGFVDIVGYMYNKVVGDDIRRLLLTQSTDRQVAKDRTGELPKIIENPTMEDIFTHVMSGEQPTTKES